MSHPPATNDGADSVDGEFEKDVSLVAKSLKWLSFGSAIINCLSAGSILLYSLYAPIFQEKLGYSQMQINAVSIAGEIGMYLPVPIFGYICDRFGPSYLSFLSSIFFGPSYVLAAIVFSNALSYQFMVVAYVFIGMGTSSMYFAGVTTCAKNFTSSRGLALALPIAAFGLSSLWQAQFVSRVFRTDGVFDVRSMFLFFSAMLAIVGLLGAVGLRVQSEEEKVACEEDGNSERTGLLTGTPGGYGAVEENGAEQELDEKRWVNSATREFLKDRTMWWFALGVFLVTGPGEAFINNMGSLIQTLYPPATSSTSFKDPIDPATHVSIVALTSTAARILAGTLSDYLAPSSSNISSHRFACSRMCLLFLFSIIMLLGQLFVASGAVEQHGERFWLVSSSIGAGYGAVFCLAPTVVSVVWGTENFGTNWGIVTMTPALGATLFGLVWAAGYDQNAGNDGVCWGRKCYQGSFAVMAGSVCLAVLGWLWAWRGRGGWRERGVVV
ncbi:putative monocarboxylate transporter mch1 [Rhizina undulata]